MAEAAGDLLAGFPVVVEQAVMWGEMDAFGHVNNVVYFRYFENARLEYARRAGWLELQARTQVGPILSAVSARFRRALTFPDTIRIGARLASVEKDRFTLEHHIVSRAQGAVVTVGEGTVVAFDYGSSQKVPLPDELRRGLEALEGRPL